MFEVSFSQALRLNSFFILVSALLSLVQWFVWALYRVRFMLSFCLFVFPLMGKAGWGGDPVYWWLGLCFCFLCCLDETSCTGCYWWLRDAGSCIQVISSVWVLTTWYSDWVTSLSVFTFMHWIRKWQPTPLFLPGESQGRGSLMGCHLWGHPESDTTEVT